jgi:periplasmic copper chaperone A
MHIFHRAAPAATILAFLAVPAMAHVSLQQKEAAPGTYKAVLGIPHGCDGEPTVSFRVELPEGFIGAKPMPKTGWTLSIEEDDHAGQYKLHDKDVTSGPVAVTWEGGSLADAHYDEFVVRGTLAGVESGQRLFFKAVQTCPSGKQEAWVDVPAEGQDAHALASPAPFVTIAAAAGGSDHHHHAAAADTAAETSVGELRIADPWVRAMLPGQPSGGGYLAIHNDGAEADRLVSISSPAAGRVEIHTMEMEGEVMVMRPVEGGLEIPAGGSVALEPGGLHLMFLEVGTPFSEGADVPVTLEFEKAGAVELSLPVRPARTGRGEHQH